MNGRDRPQVTTPFVVLGIAPTLDPANVKRAYFAALTRHPPHADPQGFRTLRSAYESLQGDGLKRAYLAAPLDLGAEAAALCSVLGSAREQAAQEARGACVPAERRAAFEALLGQELEAVLARIVG